MGTQPEPTRAFPTSLFDVSTPGRQTIRGRNEKQHPLHEHCLVGRHGTGLRGCEGATECGYRTMVGWNRPDLAIADATLSCLATSAEVSDESEGEGVKPTKDVRHPAVAAGPAKRPRLISVPDPLICPSHFVR